jgi:hypothetical protein
MWLTPNQLLIVALIMLLLFCGELPRVARSLGRAVETAKYDWFMRDWHGRLWDARTVWRVFRPQSGVRQVRQLGVKAGIGMAMVVALLLVCFWYFSS